MLLCFFGFVRGLSVDEDCCEAETLEANFPSYSASDDSMYDKGAVRRESTSVAAFTLS